LRVALISTGEEILRGEALDTNAAFAASELDTRGFEVVRRYTCGDGLEDNVDVLRLALAEADAVIACGGLGPTQDDRSAEALAALLDAPLEEDPALLSALRARFEAMGIQPSPNQARQARLPRGALGIPNPRGTAPGLRATLPTGQLVFCLPGPPGEFRPMLVENVLPALEAERSRRGDKSAYARRVLRVFGRGEGQIAHELGELEAEVPGLVLGFRAAYPEVHVKLRTRMPDRARADAVLQAAEARVRALLGDLVFSADDRGLPEVVLGLLVERGLTLAAAESCTGGLVGKLLTDLPGASRTFLLSAVTYANEMKTALLGVPAALLAEHGAVSEASARAMAEGARRVSGADLAVAVTGIAGPDGGTPEKPVGLVHFALAHPAGCLARRHVFPARDRGFVRALAAHAALDLVRRHLLGT
jgi:nicotinamide-nucleotide amidase